MPLPKVARAERARFLRFGITGFAGFAVDFGVLVALHGVVGVPLGVATIVAYALGGAVHYTLSRYWVFPQVDHTGEIGRIVRYLMLGGVNAGITLLVVLGLNSIGLEYWIAKLVAVAGLFLTNYLVMPRVVMTSPAFTEFSGDEPADDRTET